MSSNFSYVRAESLDHAIQQLAGGNARVHAGGTDLLGCLRDHVFEAERIVSLSALDDLQGIHETAGGALGVGSMTTVTELAESPLIEARYPALSQAAGAVASPQLRNQGTVGGNLCQKPRCWYYRGEFDCLRKGGDTCFAMAGDNRYHAIFGNEGCCVVHPSDLAPALIALGARVEIRGPRGVRELELEEFYVGPEDDVERETVLQNGEVLTEIGLPRALPNARSLYRKVRERGSWDFALAGAALALTFDGDKVERARVVLSGVAPKPWRLPAVENSLVERTLDAATIEAAVQAAVADAAPLEGNDYKVPLLRGVIEEALLTLKG